MKYRHSTIWNEMLPSLAWSRRWHSKEENELLCKYAEKADKYIIEVGSAEGQSSISMLLANDKVGLQVVDPFISMNLLSNIKAMDVGDRVVITPTISRKAKRVFESVDLVFIDAVHTYKEVKYDLEAWCGCKPKYIILHDTSLEGIQKAVKEFMNLYGEYRVVENLDNMMVLERSN